MVQMLLKLGIYHCLSTPTPSFPTLPTLMYMQSKMVQMWEIWYKVGISDCLVAPSTHSPHSPDPYLQIGTKVGNLIQGGISDCLVAPPPPHSPTLPTLMYMQSKMVQMRKIWYKVGISDCLGAPPPHPFPHSPDPYLQIGTNVGNLIQGGISDCLATPHFPSNFPSLPTLTNKNGTNEGNLIQGRTISFSTHHLPGFPPPPPHSTNPNIHAKFMCHLL